MVKAIDTPLKNLTSDLKQGYALKVDKRNPEGCKTITGIRSSSNWNSVDRIKIDKF